MAKEKLPKLTEADIEKLAYGGSIDRGKQYFRRGNIDNPVSYGLELSASCYGSSNQEYSLRIKLNDKGIDHTSCTCLYDQGGICKHRVALLLTYIHKPESIRQVPPLNKMLGERTKEELISIISNMIRIQPDLIATLEFVSETEKSTSGKSIDVSSIRKQVARILRNDSAMEVERWIRPIVDNAVRLFQAKDTMNAGLIYDALLSGLIDNYDQFFVEDEDYDSDLCILIDEIATGLGNCLESGGADSKTRKTWLTTLLETVFKDLDLGSIDLSPSAGEFLLEEANDEEWEWIEKSIKSKIATIDKWEREVLVLYLTERLTLRGKENEIAKVIEEFGTDKQRVFLLVEQGKTIEAVRKMATIAENSPGLVTDFADALIKVNEHAAAVKFVEDMASVKGEWYFNDWLIKFYRQPGKHGNPQKATAYQQRIFFKSPSLEKYKLLREISEKSKDWPVVRDSALNAIASDRMNGTDLLVEIALFEDDIEKALTLLSELSEWKFEHYWQNVAKAAQKKYPKDAMTLYRSAAEHLIERKNRSAYQQAIEYLKILRSLCETHSVKSEDGGWLDWSFYIETLRNKYPTLKALQEELSKARL